MTVTTFQDLEALDHPGSGEAYWWYAKGGLDNEVELPGGYAPVYENADGTQLLLITGPGKSNAATSVMALGRSGMYELRDAYWIQAGIAGVTPQRATIGSAAWERWIVDGEISAQVDPRQLDERYYASQIGCSKPQFCKQYFSYGSDRFALDETLQKKAFELSKDVKLSDSKKLDPVRTAYPQPAASGDPAVIEGDVFAGDTFTHGSLLSGQMSWYLRNATDGDGTYVVTANEEPAIAEALKRLDGAGAADISRYAVVRAASNFDQEYPGQTALQSLAAASAGGAPDGESVALRNTYLTARAVTDEIVGDWTEWRDGPPD